MHGGRDREMDWLASRRIDAQMDEWIQLLITNRLAGFVEAEKKADGLMASLLDELNYALIDEMIDRLID